MLRKTDLFLFLPVLAAVLLAPRGAVADASTTPDNRVYASAMMSEALGWNHSSGHGAGFSLGLGKPLSEHFGLELDFQRYDIHLDPGYGGFGVAEKTYGINGLVLLHRGPRWTPYLEFGAGRVNSAYTGISRNETYLSAGAGFFWRVVDHMSIRGDLRFKHLPNGIGSTAHSGVIQYPVASFGIITQFGEVSHGGTAETQPPPSPSSALASPAPADSDGDGVPDNLDQCPDTPSGVRVDSHGCPSDSDNDGVPDYRDRCPNTPPGTKVDVQGCPVKPPIEFRTMHFAFDSARLTTADKQALDSAATALGKALNFDVLVIGYTDSVGTAAYNQKLSEARTASVKRYLVAHGVAADRLTTRGRGENDPVASNKTVTGRAKNRRVELHVQKKY